MAMDTQGVLPIKYFGFASYDKSMVTFFYNCKGEIAFQKGITDDHSSFAKDGLSSIDLRNCMWQTYNQFIYLWLFFNHTHLFVCLFIFNIPR